jgi:transcriptional regulator with XRE-family HTH domain
MARKEKLKIDHRILANNLRSLRKQALLSINGIDAYTNQSSDHIRQLENIRNFVTPNVNTLLPYSVLYDVTVNDLLTKPDLKLGTNLEELETFRKKHKDFEDYFIDTLSTPDFIRLKILPLPQMKTGIKVMEIINLFPEANLKSKSLSRELSRLVEKGTLIREDLSGKRAVYIYKLNEEPK